MIKPHGGALPFGLLSGAGVLTPLLAAAAVAQGGAQPPKRPVEIGRAHV